MGFYIYRENRLIHYGDWLNMFVKDPHDSLLRVDFSFTHELDDAFNVDIKKSRVQLNEQIFIYDNEMKKVSSENENSSKRSHSLLTVHEKLIAHSKPAFRAHHSICITM